MRSISKFIQALVVLIFGIIWLCVVSTTGAPWFFSLFGVIFILIAAYIVIKAFVNR